MINNGLMQYLPTQKFNFLFYLLLLICLSDALPAQENKTDSTSTESYDLSSPYGTLLTHLKFLNDENYKPEIAAKAFIQEGVDAERAEDLAIKLFQYYNARGYYIAMDLVPREPDYFDSAKNKARFEPVSLHPEIYLEKKGNIWLYSINTINEIERLHSEAFPFGTDKLLTLLPKIGQDKYLGLHIWQLVGLLMLILAGVILHKIFTWLIDEVLFRGLEYYGYKGIGRKYLLPVARPFSYFILIAFAVIFVRVLQLPVETGRFIILVLNILQPLFGTIVFYRIADVLSQYLALVAERTESTLDDQLVPLVRKTLKAFVIVVGGLIILQEGLNVDIWPILTGLSIGGLALALAAQDTLKNFFGSIMIFIDKPFQIGHFITSGEIEGTVEEVGFRSTRIRTMKNSLQYVPNAKLADSVIDNNGLRQYRRFSTTLTITYDTPPALIELFVEGLREIVERHPDTRKDFYNIYFNDLGSHSLNIMFYIFFTVPTWPEELKAKHEILLDIMKLAQALGIRFAFPTQTLFVEEIPGKPSLTPGYPSDPAQLRARLDAYQSAKN
jgi:MscS family membrane protein